MENAIFAAIVAAVIGGIALVVVASVREESEFMADCTKEKKQYECTALWRAGNSHTSVVAVPVNVGGR